MGHPLAGSCVALNIIRSIDHDQPQKKFQISLARFSILRLRSVQFFDFELFSHRITLSALAKTLGGIVNPICLAAFRLTMNSNFVGCSTGSSAGLAPFIILST